MPVGWYGSEVEPNEIEIVRRSFAIRNLPSRLEGTTAIQLSDIHLHEADALHQQMIDMVNRENPDYVFFTGDLVNDFSAVPHAAEIFKRIQPPGGTFAVVGNSDLTADAVDQLKASLSGARVRYLVDESTQIESGLWLVGVNDPSAWLSDVGTAVQGIPAAAPRILLAHSPDIVDQMDGARFDLVLAGHTHGGQVNLPFFDGAWMLNGPSSQYVKGIYNVDGTPLYVNRGIGTAKIPIRLGARPEITKITFHAA